MNLPKLLVPVSVASGPPVEVVLSEAVRRGALTGKRRAAQDRACKEQNKNRYCRPIYRIIESQDSGLDISCKTLWSAVKYDACNETVRGGVGWSGGQNNN